MSNHEIGALSDEEIAIILDHRARREKEARINAFRLKSLKVSTEYETWLQAHGEGDSFTTFVNAFGYQDKDAEKIHAQTKKIRGAASHDLENLLK